MRREGRRRGLDNSAFAPKERVLGCEMKIIYGAGHACHMEQPWLFDQYVLAFLKEHKLFPGLPAKA